MKPVPDYDPGTGVQVFCNYLEILDSGLRRNDDMGRTLTFYEAIKRARVSFFTDIVISAKSSIKAERSYMTASPSMDS
ncbi:MAG: hypothetical protein R6U13_07690 [Desulfatiglandaceae bacterium]